MKPYKDYTSDCRRCQVRGCRAAPRGLPAQYSVAAEVGIRRAGAQNWGTRGDLINLIRFIQFRGGDLHVLWLRADTGAGCRAERGTGRGSGSAVAPRPPAAWRILRCGNRCSGVSAAPVSRRGWPLTTLGSERGCPWRNDCCRQRRPIRRAARCWPSPAENAAEAHPVSEGVVSLPLASSTTRSRAGQRTLHPASETCQFHPVPSLWRSAAADSFSGGQHACTSPPEPWDVAGHTGCPDAVLQDVVIDLSTHGDYTGGTQLFGADKQAGGWQSRVPGGGQR